MKNFFEKVYQKIHKKKYKILDPYVLKKQKTKKIQKNPLGPHSLNNEFFI